jgi:hypothetical protein
MGSASALAGSSKPPSLLPLLLLLLMEGRAVTDTCAAAAAGVVSAQSHTRATDSATLAQLSPVHPPSTMTHPFSTVTAGNGTQL